MGRIVISETAILVQTAAILISAGAAIWLVHVSRAQSKKRATVEMLLKMRLDSDYISHRNDFTKLIKAEDNLSKYASIDHAKSDTAMLICRVLNYHEYLATGISEGAFDEEIYKRMSYSNCLRDWSRLKSFVIELRRIEGSNTLFQEFEDLSIRWKSKPLEDKSR